MIDDLIGDLVSDDEVIFGLDRGLRILANDAGQTVAKTWLPATKV